MIVKQSPTILHGLVIFLGKQRARDQYVISTCLNVHGDMWPTVNSNWLLYKDDDGGGVG